jgi:putative cell wall-binding protein
MWRRLGVLGLAVTLIWVGPVVQQVSQGKQPTTSVRQFAVDFAGAARALASADGWTESPVMAAGDTVMVGADWGGREGVEVEVRARADGAWSDWFELETDTEHQPDPGSGEAERAAATSTASDPVWLGRSDQLQFRVRGGQPDLTVHAVDVAGGDGLAWTPQRSGRLTTAEAAPAEPSIRSRASWGADESLVKFGPRYARDVRFSVLHHTAGNQPNIAAGCNDADDIIRGTYSYHVNVRGFDDIAYNLIVDPCGGVWEGRAGGITKPVIGAHAAGWNGGSTGIVLLGNYQSTHTLTEAMIKATTDLLAWKLDVHHIDPRGTSLEIAGGGGTNRYSPGTLVEVPAISAHTVTNGTACPGSTVLTRLFDGSGSNATPKESTRQTVLTTGLPKAFGGLPQQWEQPVAGPRPTWDVATTEPVDWSLRITDVDGNVVRATGGTGEDDVERTWDMRDADGNLVAGGAYTATWQARGPSGDVTPIVTEMQVTDPAERKSGSGRVQTALELSRWSFDNSEEVILASASVYADALVATPLAGSYNAPVLLVSDHGLDDEVLDEIERLGAYRALIVGGTGTVPARVETQLAEAGFASSNVERFGGETRFHTAGLVTDRIVAREGGKEVLLALGDHPDKSRAFPDALSAGWFGAALDLPLLLVQPDRLTEPTRARLDSLKPDEITIFGGTGSISPTVEEDARQTGMATMRRFAGATRYETSQLAAVDLIRRVDEWREDNNTDPHAVDLGLEVVFASGANWPDALGAGAAASVRGALFLLVHPEDITHSTSTHDYLVSRADEFSHAVIAGGPATVADQVLAQLTDIVLSKGPHLDESQTWSDDPHELDPTPTPSASVSVAPSASASASASESPSDPSPSASASGS